jgi:hypothetical protein
MKSKLIRLALPVLFLAACSQPTVTPTATVPAATSLPTAVPATATPAITATRAPVVSETLLPPSATPEASPARPSDALLRAYRLMISMQVNAVLFNETATRVAAGELDTEDLAVAFVALTALTQAVDEDLPGFVPPAELAEPWETALAAHNEVKSIAGRLTIGLLDAAAARDALAVPITNLETALVSADEAVSTQFGVSGPRLTEYRHQISRAAQRLYDE